jgi:phosphoglycolate phosphatase
MLDALIFDKDGTLFDFRASWGAWTRSLLAVLTTDEASARALGRVLGFDTVTGDFSPDSPVIAQTVPEISAVILPHVQGHSLQSLTDFMTTLSAEAPMVPAVDLRAVLGGLKARGMTLGLATNDSEVPARAHLAGAGVLDLFDFVAGCDSGWGASLRRGSFWPLSQHMGWTLRAPRWWATASMIWTQAAPLA